MFIVLGPCFPFCSGCFWGPSGRSSKKTKKKPTYWVHPRSFEFIFHSFLGSTAFPSPDGSFFMLFIVVFCVISDVLFLVFLMCSCIFHVCFHVFPWFSMFFHVFAWFSMFLHVFAWFSMFLHVFTMLFPCFFHVFCCFLLAFCLLFGPFLHICLDHRLSPGPVVLWWGN